MRIDQIYVINLGTAPSEIIARLNQLGLEAGTRFLITEAVDGQDIRPLEYAWKAAAAVPRAEVGRALSHLNVWLDAKKNGYASVLILEEHFLPDVMVSALPAPPNGWDLVLLSRERGAKKEPKAGASFVRPAASEKIRAYMLSTHGVQRLLDRSLADDVVPLEAFLSASFGKASYATVKPAFRQIAAANRTKQTVSGGILDDADWEAWKRRYVDPAIARGDPELVMDEVGPRFSNIFEIPLFTERFCSELIALAEMKNMWTDSRHQFYPTNDTTLVNLGVNRMYSRVLKEIVVPSAMKIWQLEGAEWKNATAESFIVRYTTTQQDHLALHHDVSAITSVVKLNDAFEGGGTYFPRYSLCVTPRRIGHALLHPGAVTHRHGARPIYKGKRFVSVSFIRPTP